MPMKRMIARGFVALLCLAFLLLPAGCGADSAQVDTLLTLDASCTGERVMLLSLPGIDPSGESGQRTDALLNASCPKELTYTKEDGGYRFVLRFSSYSDYVSNLTSLLNREPDVIFSMPDTLLTSGYRIKEDFDSSELFTWLETAAQNAGEAPQTLEISCGKTALRLEENTQTTESRINASASRDATPIDAVDVSTLRRADGFYNRTVVFSIPRSTVNELGDDLTSYLNARTPKNTTAAWEDYASGRKYSVRMDGLTVEELQQATNLLFNTQLTGTISYGEDAARTKPFNRNRAFEETIDLTSYTGPKGSDVLFTYRYAVEEAIGQVSIETRQEGEWQQTGSSSEGACELSQRTDHLRVRIPEQTVYALEKTEISLSCLGKGQFERTIDFLYSPQDTEGPQYAAAYFLSKNSGAQVEHITGESPSCRLTLAGSAEEITAQASALFGEGNHMTYESDGGAAELHKKTALNDTLRMSHLFADGHQDALITYTIQTNGNEQLDALEYKSENHASQVRLDQGQQGEVSFELQSGDTQIVYNGNTPNTMGVFLALLGTGAAIALAILIVLYVRKNGGKGPRKRPHKTFDPNENIEDILSGI